MLKTHTTTLNGTTFTYFDVDCMASNSIGRGKPWEPHITRFVTEYNNLIGIQDILDIGANFGYHTVLFSGACKGRVHAFEPQPQNYALLEINTHNTKNVLLYNVALGDQSTSASIPLFKDTFPGAYNMGDITVNHSYTGQQEMVDISVVPIDSLGLADKVSLIKLDVQGYELKVLEGARQLIHRDHPVLIVEMEDHQLTKVGKTSAQLIELIGSMGYYIYFLDYTYPSDHVCVHMSQLDTFETSFAQYIKPHTTTNHYNHNVEHGINKKITFT